MSSGLGLMIQIKTFTAPLSCDFVSLCCFIVSCFKDYNTRSILHHLKGLYCLDVTLPCALVCSSHGLTEHQSENSESDDTLSSRSGPRQNKVKFPLSWARTQLAWHPTPFYQHFRYKHLFMPFSSHGRRSKSYLTLICRFILERLFSDNFQTTPIPIWDGWRQLRPMKKFLWMCFGGWWSGWGVTAVGFCLSD